MPRLSNDQLDYVLANCPWWPQEGPQTDAFDSKADVLLYGGAAGGGKTALAVGLAAVSHRETLFIRKEATQLTAVVDYMAEVAKSRDGYSGHTNVFKLPAWDGKERKVLFGSVPHPGAEQKYQGRPRDLLVIDEAANLTEAPIRFLMGWVRSTVKGQRCRTVLASNPPTGPEGYWIVEMFAPWLDPTHDNPAKPGELRWFAMIAGKEMEVDNGKPFRHNGEKIIPQSRTFIPARVQDNAYLRDTGYIATLQALPEPLRSQMLKGDFMAGRDDAAYQVIPTAWVEAAMERWEPKEFDQSRIVSVGVDPSRGGDDATVMSCREDWYFHELDVWDGIQMPDGQSVAAKVIERVSLSHCPVHVDVIGIGASVVDILRMYIHSRVIPVNVAESKSIKGDKDWSGELSFINKRAQLWWQFRDLLDPGSGRNVALPQDNRLKAELCAPTYELKANGIQVESKEQIRKRLGRSTDMADAVIMAAERSPIGSISGLSGRVAVNSG